MKSLFSLQLRRFCSSTISRDTFFSEEELKAVLELKRKSERFVEKSADSILKSRCWAKACVLEVSGRKPPMTWGRVGKRGNRFVDEDHVEQSVVKLRWANIPERDVDILMSPEETLYTIEVKAVLYGIIQAINYNEKKLRMKSTNEVVVKVANKTYKASKEAASFHLIHRVVNRNDTKNSEDQMKAKIERISEPDKPIRRISSTTMTENGFFQKYRNSIEILKTYS